VNRKFISMATGLAMAVGSVAPAFAADLTPQPVSQVNVSQLADGYRTSKLVGATVKNSANETIGTVDDLLVGRSDKVLYAILSVGGFLGIGSKLVAVPYTALQIEQKNLVLPNANKDRLKAQPEFKYATS
jgi:hypothetical protein